MTLANVPPPALGDFAPAVAAAHSGRMAPPPEGPDLGDWLVWAANTAARTYTTDLVYYLLGAGLTFLVLWVAFRGRLAHRRIDPSYPEARHLRREILYSLATIAVFAAIGVGLTYAALAGWTRLYIDFDAYGWFHWIASVAALVVLHDAYFYWTHRSATSRAPHTLARRGSFATLRITAGACPATYVASSLGRHFPPQGAEGYPCKTSQTGPWARQCNRVGRWRAGSRRSAIRNAC